MHQQRLRAFLFERGLRLQQFGAQLLGLRDGALAFGFGLGLFDAVAHQHGGGMVVGATALGVTARVGSFALALQGAGQVARRLEVG